MFAAQVFLRLVAALIAILLPFPLARYLYRTHGTPWSLFRTGCLTFVISQVFHIPFNAIVLKAAGMKNSLPEAGSTTLIYLAVFLGLSAGIFEETTRYLAYRYHLKSPASRTYKAALMFGTGHGGIESILLVGVGGIAQLVGMTIMRNKDLESMGISADQTEILEKQIHDYWETPWYGVLMADLERIFAITCHLAMTVLVAQCFRRSTVWWVFLAILYHAALDCFVVLAMVSYGVYITELFVGLWAVMSLSILWFFREEDDGYEKIDATTGESASSTPVAEFQELSNTKQDDSYATERQNEKKGSPRVNNPASPSQTK